MLISRRDLLALTVATTCLPACIGGGRANTPEYRTWGRAGVGKGEFNKPRAIGVHNGEVYVIDMTGRVQVFSCAGEFRRAWSMPDTDNGTPTGIAFEPDGTVVIPDTHYSRIMAFTPDGVLRRKWGSYGAGHEQFIYPTDIAADSGGELFISEYGENAERVHVFDSAGRFLRQWGEHGDSPGSFNRAMAIAVDTSDMVFVCDTANHRIQCFDEKGVLSHVIGGLGSEPGQLKFPYDMELAPDGTIFVCEYGNNRISRFTRQGGLLAVYGGPGRDVGLFHGPRGVAVSDRNEVFVADTGNNRVQAFEVKPASVVTPAQPAENEGGDTS